MNLTKKYASIRWTAAVSSILDECKLAGRPALIVRSMDNLNREFQIWRYLKTKYKGIYVRMGPACSMAHLFDEILSQLRYETTRASYGYNDKTIRLIISILGDRTQPTLIVIDNCNKLLLSSISYLIGLMIHLGAKVQFLFLTTKVKLKVWIEHFNNTPVGALFFKVVQKGYQITM